MAYKTFKDSTIKIDNASGTITSITAYTNQASIQGAMDTLEVTALGDEAKEYEAGTASASLPLNGFINSTTNAIFGPLVGARTSITKSFCFGNGVRYFTGEAWPSSTKISGNANELQTWSCNLQVTGEITMTSVVST